MLQSGLLTKNFIGRDGFIWWIGQVPDAKTWQGNIPELPKSSEKDLPGFKHRVKVRIIGYHTADVKQLKDDDLPWALIMLPTTAGSGSGGNGQTPRFAGGEFVFGFFLDGDNGQQPVIIGLLGNSGQTLLSKTIPPGGAGYNPISGYTSNGKKVPPHSVKESKQIESQTTPNPGAPSVPTGSSDGTPQVNVSSNKPNPKQSPNTEGGQGPGDVKTQHQEAQQEDNKEYALANACKSNKKEMSGIQKAIKNFMKFMKSIQKYYDAYISPITNKIQDIQKEIQKVTGIISGFIKSIIGKIRGFVLDKINKGIEKVVGLLPIKKQIAVGEAQQKSIDLISCIFNKIVDSLGGLISKFLSSAVESFITTPLCVAESLVSSLLDNVLGQVESGIQKAMDSVNQLLGAVDSIAGQVFSALNFVSSISSFFSCEQEDNCPEQESWSWLDGPKPESATNFQKVVDQIGSFPSNLTQQGVSGITSSLNSITGGGFFSSGGSSENTSSCNTGLANCGPPKVSIFGGGGIGALANAVVGGNGQILAVDIINQGIDYISNPFVAFQDDCGNGKGARAKVNVFDGKVVAIDIIDGGNGYLSAPNGSLGGNGNTLVGVGSTSYALILPNGNKIGIGSTTFGSTGIITSITNPAGIITACQLVTGGPGIYLDLSGYTGVQNVKITTSESSQIFHSITIPDVDVIKENLVSKIYNLEGGKVYGPCITPNGKLYIGDETPVGGKNKLIVEEGDDDWNDMVLNVSVGNFIRCPGGPIQNQTGIGVTLPISLPISVKCGSLVNLPPGACVVVSTAASTIAGLPTDFTKSGSTYCFPSGAIITIPCPSGNAPIGIGSTTKLTLIGIGSTGIGIGSTGKNTSGIATGQYGAIVQIDDTIIGDTGIYYDPNDKIKIIPDNGANLKPLFDPFGRLVSVKILNKGRPVTSRPRIIIESETGINAEIFPILRVKRYGDIDLTTQKVKPEELLIVIDCVGKPNG